MDKESIKVSVIIPVYNTAPFLKECVDSVIHQTVSDIEIICVNDGSTDNSLTILNEIKIKEPRIQIISIENSGLSIARNTGIKIARGEFIYFLDSDDFIDTMTLETLYMIASEEQLDVIYFDAIAFSDNPAYQNHPAIRDQWYQRKKSFNTTMNGQLLYKTLISNHAFDVSACFQMIRRSYLEETQVHFEPNILYEDELFSLQVILSAKKAKHIRKSFYHYRIRSKSINTSKLTHKNIEGRFFTATTMLTYCINSAYEQNTQDTILAHAQKVLDICRLYYVQLSSSEKRKIQFRSELDKFLFGMLVHSWTKAHPFYGFYINVKRIFFPITNRIKSIIHAKA